MDLGASFSLRAWQCWGQRSTAQGRLPKVPPAAGTQLTLQRQRQVLGSQGGRSRDFSFIPYSSHFSLCPPALATHITPGTWPSMEKPKWVADQLAGGQETPKSSLAPSQALPDFSRALPGSLLSCSSPTYPSLQIITIDLPGVGEGKREGRHQRRRSPVSGSLRSLGLCLFPLPVSPPHSGTLGRHSPVLVFAPTAESFALKRERR